MKRKHSGRVPDFTNNRDERVKILTNSCISKVGRIRVTVSGKSCAARSEEWGMQSASPEEQ